MKPYADTNLFTRFYLDLPDSEAADGLVAEVQSGENLPLPVTWLHRIELVNAFEHSVYLGRQPDHPRVAPEQAAIALATFREDLAKPTFLRPARLPEAELERQAEALALRHTAKHGFRTYDLLHVAAALLLDCDTFWSFDARALKLARLEGLRAPAITRR
jgi:predicted nucleic acid-binding protein